MNANEIVAKIKDTLIFPISQLAHARNSIGLAIQAVSPEKMPTQPNANNTQPGDQVLGSGESVKKQSCVSATANATKLNTWARRGSN